MTIPERLTALEVKMTLLYKEVRSIKRLIWIILVGGGVGAGTITIPKLVEAIF